MSPAAVASLNNSCARAAEILLFVYSSSRFLLSRFGAGKEAALYGRDSLENITTDQGAIAGRQRQKLRLGRKHNLSQLGLCLTVFFSVHVFFLYLLCPSPTQADMWQTAIASSKSQENCTSNLQASSCSLQVQLKCKSSYMSLLSSTGTQADK